MKKYFFLFVYLISLYAFSTGCSFNYKETQKILNSADNSEDVIIETCYDILDEKVLDKNIIKDLLTHIIDFRLSTSFKYNMECPYTLRVKCLEQITGKNCPYKITDSIDALIIDFYLDIAINEGIISSKDQIELIHPIHKTNNSSEIVLSNIDNHDKVDFLKKYYWPRPALQGKLYSK